MFILRKNNHENQKKALKQHYFVVAQIDCIKIIVFCCFCIRIDIAFD